MADSTISNLPSLSVPSNSDVIPIVNSNTTKKITVSNLLAASPGLSYPYCRMFLNNVGSRGSFYSLSSGGCNNNTSYVMCLDSKFESDSSTIEGDTTNENIIIKGTGIYLISSRMGFFDMNGGGKTGRIRLYSSSTLQFPGPGGTFLFSGGQSLVSTLALNYSVTESIYGFLTGEATWSGSTILRVTSVPLYLQLAIHVTGGTANSNQSAYLVVDNTYGNQCEFVAQKISNL